MDDAPPIFVDIVIDQILFFSTCTDSQCPLDTAVQALETIAGSFLHQGTPDDRRLLLARARQRLQSETDPEARESLRTLRDALGFEEE